jgi:hypothetical protein
MTGKVLRLAILCLVLASCSPSPNRTEPPPIPTETALATKTAIPTSTSTLIPTPTNTPTPTPSPTPDPIRISIETLRSSPYWREDTIPDGLKVILDRYLAANAHLTKSELATLKDFIAQWNEWQDRLGRLYVPENEKLELRVKEFASDELDLVDNRSNLLETRFVLYAVNTLAQVPDGNEQLYLLTPQAEPWGLPVAPILKGLRQQISSDGKYVVYFDESGQQVLKADAFQFQGDWPSDQNPNHYTVLTGFPRFSLSYPGIKATIYLMDPKIETHVLKDKIDYAISILNEDPDLAPLRENLFAKNFILYSHESLAKDHGGIVGMAEGQGYIQIDPGYDPREILLILVHEAVHLLQHRQGLYDLTGCQREIGDGKIPPRFLEFTGDELMSAAKNGEIGTVHVELWLATKISAPKTFIEMYKEEIRIKGRGTWDYCK